MEERQRRLTELIVALIFVAILFIVSLSIMNSSKNQKEEIQPTTQIIYVSNSYVPENPLLIEKKVQKIYSCVHNEEQPCFYKYEISHDKPQRSVAFSNKEYSYYGERYQKLDFLAGYINEYRVYVLNKERIGNYFTVVFNFKDGKGYEYSESITRYLMAGEKKLFLYKDIWFEKREIVNWNYVVKKE